MLIVWYLASQDCGLSMKLAPLGREYARKNGQLAVKLSPSGCIVGIDKHTSESLRSDNQEHMVYPGQGSHFQAKSGQMVGCSMVNLFGRI